MPQRIKYVADESLARITHGLRVNRATAALPATATAAIFTIAGGRIRVLQLLGEVTTVIQTQLCNVKVQSNPTAAGTSVDLCANLNVTAAPVAALFGITGVAADALITGLAILAQTVPLILQAGTIDLVTSATNTGSVKWMLRYIPLDDGVTVVPA